MAITAQYMSDFEKNYTKIVYQLLKEKLFVSFGLELTATKVKFLENSTFPLVGKTFAYYNPVDDSVCINIEDPFFTKCTSADMVTSKLIFILFHEAYHKTLMHTERRGTKDHSIWNIASDYEVHNMLYLYSEVCKSDTGNALKHNFEQIKNMLEIWNNPKNEPDPKSGEYGMLFSEKLLDKVAEEIYQMVISTKKVSEKTYTMSLSQMQGSSSSQQMGQNTPSDSSSDNDSESEGNSSSNSNKNNKSKKSNQQGSSDNNSQLDQKGEISENETGKTGEDIDSEGNQKGKSNKSLNKSNTVKITETTYKLPDGRKHTVVDIQWPDINNKSKEQEKEDKNNKELRRQLMEQNLRQTAERNKGNLSTQCEMFLKKLFKIKVDWEKILKASLQTILSKSDYFSWAKPRTSMFALDMYLPEVVEDTESYGTLIVARDESGSMSDEEVAKAGSIIADAKEHYKKIIILKHDTEIQYEGEFEELSDDVIKMLCTRATCGGTSHEEVFKYIAEYNKKHRYEEESISCVILMTDCCSDIQDTQHIVPSNIPMVYLVPKSAMSYTKDIRGKIIPIED